jgi:hypothetical protein
MVRVEKDHRFEGPEGEVSLLDLFEGRRQLIVYRFFLDPGMDIASYPEDGCPGCTMFAGNLPNLTHLNARDTTLVFVSAGSQDAIRNYRKRMGLGRLAHGASRLGGRWRGERSRCRRVRAARPGEATECSLIGGCRRARRRSRRPPWRRRRPARSRCRG